MFKLLNLHRFTAVLGRLPEHTNRFIVHQNRPQYGLVPIPFNDQDLLRPARPFTSSKSSTEIQQRRPLSSFPPRAASLTSASPAPELRLVKHPSSSQRRTVVPPTSLQLLPTSTSMLRWSPVGQTMSVVDQAMTLTKPPIEQLNQHADELGIGPVPFKVFHHRLYH